MPNEKSYGSWNFKQCKTNVEDLFENKAVHSFFTCKDADCSTIHTDSQIFKKFKHSWLNSKNWWLCFVENEGMFNLFGMQKASYEAPTKPTQCICLYTKCKIQNRFS